MPIYSLYGLTLRANQPIPGLVNSITSAPEDVLIWFGHQPPWIEQIAKRETWYTSSTRDEKGDPLLLIQRLDGGDYYHLHYADETAFFVAREGTHMWVTWPDALTPEDAATYLLGPVMGFVLLLRGTTCLHASAVRIGDQAVALLGPSGAGKSTTAAAFAKAGFAVLTEDVIAIAEQGDRFLAYPSYPCIRLWPSSVNALYGRADALPRLTPTWDKLYLDLTSEGYQFQAEALPLGAIYLLGERREEPAAPYIEEVRAGEGLIQLVGNTYAAHLLDRQMRARDFTLLGRLTVNLPLRRVTPHADAAYLSKLCEVIVDDFQVLMSGRSS